MKKTASRLVTVLALALGTSVGQAETPSEAAHAALKRMTDYVSGLSAVSFDFSVELEAVTTEGIKLQFPASGQVLLKRPGQFRFSRTGAYSDILLISDGKTLTLFGRRANAYAQKTAPESLDAFINKAHEQGIEMPGADLLLTNVHEELTGPVTTAMYLGSGPVDGVECEHLAFRTAEIDWQIWIAAGDKPFPCRYVVTSKWITGAPQYQLRISNWNDSPEIAANAFEFQPTGDARKVELTEIGPLDILLPETVQGAKR